MQAGPQVDARTGAVRFAVAPVKGQVPQRVWYHLRAFGDDPRFRRNGRSWVAEIPPPPVDRMEYLLVVRDADGSEAMVLDPAARAAVPGVFGDHSEVLLPGYRPPEWLGEESPPWSAEPLDVGTDVEGTQIKGELLTPADSTDADVLPLLVVHDGPEYVRLVRLLDYLHWLAQRRDSLRCRVLALQPVDRNLSYAANDTYTEALVRLAIPLARTMAPSVGPIVGVGASLGALALAHGAATHPGTFGGLFLQSGSFFLPQHDAHEKRFRFYDEVVAATAHLHSSPPPLTGVEVTITTGLGEENLDNNRALAARLSGVGVETRIVEGRDGHNHIAWRDLLHPGLADLLSKVWDT